MTWKKLAFLSIAFTVSSGINAAPEINSEEQWNFSSFGNASGAVVNSDKEIKLFSLMIICTHSTQEFVLGFQNRRHGITQIEDEYSIKIDDNPQFSVSMFKDGQIVAASRPFKLEPESTGLNLVNQMKNGYAITIQNSDLEFSFPLKGSENAIEKVEEACSQPTSGKL